MAEPNESDRRAAVAFFDDDERMPAWLNDELSSGWVMTGEPPDEAPMFGEVIRIAQAFAAHREQAEREEREACAKVIDDARYAEDGETDLRCLRDRIRARGKR